MPISAAGSPSDSLYSPTFYSLLSGFCFIPNISDSIFPISKSSMNSPSVMRRNSMSSACRSVGYKIFQSLMYTYNYKFVIMSQLTCKAFFSEKHATSSRVVNVAPPFAVFSISYSKSCNYFCVICGLISCS